MGWCPSCGTDKMKRHPEEERTDQSAVLVAYHYYDYVDEPTTYRNADGSVKFTRHLKLLKHAPVPIGEFMVHYRQKLQFHCYHRGMIRLTTLMRLLRAGFAPGEVTLIMDYSEKLNKCRRQQIQSEHWDTTAMTLEVAVIEAYHPDLDDDALADLRRRLHAAKPADRKETVAAFKSTHKKVYYHCSDFKKQVAAVSTYNMRVMIEELIKSGELGLRPGSESLYQTVWLKTDGCGKQYKCSRAMYLLCVLAHETGVTIDQMLEVTGHGKDEADGHGGVLKSWLTSQMRRVDLTDDDNVLGVETADVVDGDTNSFAETMAAIARAGMTHLKEVGMNAKRKLKSLTAARYFKTYTEADIGEPPNIASMTKALSLDAPKGRTSTAHVAHDKMVKATLGHNNYRADPELQGATKVIAVRRLACRCAGCERHLQLPVGQRYAPHDDCEYAAIFERLNDWKLVKLLPGDDDAAEEMEEDDDLHLQDRTDAKLTALAPGEYLSFYAPHDPACPEHHYLAQCTSAAYPLDADTTLDELKDADGASLKLDAGSYVVDCTFLERVRGVTGATDWYLPYPADDPRWTVRVPSHLVLHAGFAMEATVEPAGVEYAQRKTKKWNMSDARREATRKGAVRLVKDVHSAIQDEMDLRA